MLNPPSLNDHGNDSWSQYDGASCRVLDCIPLPIRFGRDLETDGDDDDHHCGDCHVMTLIMMKMMTSMIMMMMLVVVLLLMMMLMSVVIFKLNSLAMLFSW